MMMKLGDARFFRRATAIDTGSLRAPPESAGPASPGGGLAQTAPRVSEVDLKGRLPSTAFAFRGYDVTNLGRSLELLEHAVYGPVVRRVLDQVSEISTEAVGEKIDLASYIRANEASSLATFTHDVATIVAMEMAQLQILEEVFDVPIRKVRLSFGYSVGEVSALIYGGVFSIEQLLPVPLGCCRDCAELAADTSLGVLFTRRGSLPIEDVERLCLAIRGEGKGLIGPSAYLTPNTALILGQGDTLDRLERAIPVFLPEKTHLRRNPNRWPPLHSPLVWQRHIPNRTAVALYRIEGAAKKPEPTILSCVTGSALDDVLHTRELLVRWTDHPQRLWDVIDATLASGVDSIIHVGPAPKLIAATFTRLANNVGRYLGNGYLHVLGRGLVNGMTRHSWLARLLPSRSALLRAPYVVHVMLEDWLLEQQVPRATAVSLATATPEPGEHVTPDQPATSA
ncbi:MAG: ACP S-malonyltransferase [Planctomycetaceae bacterium]|nr:ACP S-malonyltransferase [Planctomycetaceae bacterium]